MKFPRGAYAAALTPRNDAGAVDWKAFERQMTALGRTSLKGTAVNGATGMYCLTAKEELVALLPMSRQALPGRPLLCGIGAGDLRGTLRLGRIAVDAGVEALLLPLPFFYPYMQQDAVAFVQTVARELPADIVLYNLPQFTSGYSVETVLHLLRMEERVIGIKDSSGSLEILRAITEECLPALRLMGNDAALCDALEGNLCDGVVSGVASALPALLCEFFEQEPGSSRFAELRDRLHTFLARIAGLPTPWGLIATSAVAGLGGGSYPLPPASEREQEIAELCQWFAAWHV